MLAGPFLASKIVCRTPALPIESAINEPALPGSKLSQHENWRGLLEVEERRECELRFSPVGRRSQADEAMKVLR